MPKHNDFNDVPVTFWMGIMGKEPDEWLRTKVDPSFKCIMRVMKEKGNKFYTLISDTYTGILPENCCVGRFGNKVPHQFLIFLETRSYMTIIREEND